MVGYQREWVQQAEGYWKECESNRGELSERTRATGGGLSIRDRWRVTVQIDIEMIERQTNMNWFWWIDIAKISWYFFLFIKFLLISDILINGSSYSAFQKSYFFVSHTILPVICSQLIISWMFLLFDWFISFIFIVLHFKFSVHQASLSSPIAHSLDF